MGLCVKTENNEFHEVKAIYKGSADGTPIKLEEDTPEYWAAVRVAVMQGLIISST